jgi:glucose/arabinose dehydrogenase
LDPDFATNGYVYIAWMERISQNPNTYKGYVERFTDVNNVGTDRTMIVGDLPTKTTDIHALNSIHFGPDGKLYISIGDNGLTTEEVQPSQDLSTPIGKLLRVNKEDGSAPADNPFVNTPGADPRIYAYGFRNSFDFTFHPENGSLYMTENGPSSCDELNLIVPGGNYEWPHGFDMTSWPGYPDGETCEGGVGIPAMYYFRFFEWMEGWNINSTTAPVGIMGIDGDDFPALGHSLITCEFRNTVLRLLQLGGPNLDQVIAEPRLINTNAAPDSCLVDVEISPGHDIYFTTSNSIRRLIIDSDGGTIEDQPDNCDSIANTDQADFDADTLGDVCDPDDDNDGTDDGPDPDDDNDAVRDTDEANCGGTTPSLLRPERLDGAFAAVDDDGDTEVDEPLPGGAADFDCDGDGYTGTAEDHVVSYLPQTNGDQKACQEYDSTFPNAAPHIRPSKRWPSDIASSAFSLNKINIQDLSAFISPIRYLGQDVGTDPGDVRFDLVPGSTVGTNINIVDLAAITAGATGFPPMLGGAKAFGGPVCPYAP